GLSPDAQPFRPLDEGGGQGAHPGLDQFFSSFRGAGEDEPGRAHRSGPFPQEQFGVFLFAAELFRDGVVIPPFDQPQQLRFPVQQVAGIFDGFEKFLEGIQEPRFFVGCAAPHPNHGTHFVLFHSDPPRGRCGFKQAQFVHRAVKDQRRLPDVELGGLVPRDKRSAFPAFGRAYSVATSRAMRMMVRMSSEWRTIFMNESVKIQTKAVKAVTTSDRIVFPKWYGFGTRALGMRISSVIRPSSWTATARFHRSLRRCRFLARSRWFSLFSRMVRSFRGFRRRPRRTMLVLVES